MRTDSSTEVLLTESEKGNKMHEATQKTRFGPIPEEWNLKEIRHLALILFSNVDKHIKKNEKAVLLCNYQDVYYNEYIFKSIKFSKGSVKPSEFQKFKLQRGDVIITKDSEDRSDIAVASYVLEEVSDLVCAYHLAIIRPTEHLLDGLFLSNLFSLPSINHQFQRLANGVTRFGLTVNAIKSAHVPVPPIQEQKRIAEILSSWDLAISICKNLIASLKTRNKGLAQQLLSGKKRLKGFEGEWEEVKANKLFKNHADKTHGGKLEVLSATQERGVIPRSLNNIDIKYDPRSLRNYKKVEVGDFVISLRSFQGGIEYSYYEGIVSPAYTVLKELLPISKTFYRLFFKTETFINRLNTIIYGIRDGKQISYKEFSTLKLPYPPTEEQLAIAQVLEEADRELRLHEQKLTTLKDQKKGLMQKLLTGEVRVNVENH